MMKEFMGIHVDQNIIWLWVYLGHIEKKQDQFSLTQITKQTLY